MRFLPFLMWLLCAPVMAAVGDGKFDLDIPAADADIALKHLSRQTGHSVIFQSVEVEDIQTNSLAGRYTIHVAIEVLKRSVFLSSLVPAQFRVAMEISPQEPVLLPSQDDSVITNFLEIGFTRRGFGKELVRPGRCKQGLG